ncbi:MAG TPA: hypothetical protein VH853_20530 [Polyangia bacterium]|jgi:hypothetical protein|nr:hypothetical protein [Polyangia bacterium]
MSTAETAKGPPLFGLPAAGVAFGALWVAGAFAALFYCFASNYLRRPSVPAEELAIANAALSPAGGETHREAPGPAPQP